MECLPFIPVSMVKSGSALAKLRNVEISLYPPSIFPFFSYLELLSTFALRQYMWQVLIIVCPQYLCGYGSVISSMNLNILI